MSKFIPVEPEKWAEMVKAQAENARLKALTVEMDKTINASQAECRRLKAEVERLTSDLQMEKENEDRLVREWQRANNEVYGLKTQVAALIDDQIRLKAEVDRLKKFSDEAVAHIAKEERKSRERLEMAQAEVERLTQLNDTLALRYDATNSMLDGCAKEIEEMEAEIERLTKADS
jgi:chromosome segregation ATPase